MDRTESAGELGNVVAAVQVTGEQAVIMVCGEVDVATAPDLRGAVERCLGAGVTTLTFDVGAVEFVGSAGLAVLGFAIGALGGDNVAVRNPPKPVRRLLELSGMADVIQVTGAAPTEGSTA